MSQFKYRDYRPGPHFAGVFVEELMERTKAQNVAFEKMMTERLQEERRLRDSLDGYPSGGNLSSGNHVKRKGGGGLFWLAAFAFVGAKLLHLF